MTKLANMFMACLIAVAFVGAPLAAFARDKDRPNSGFCKSGFQTSDIKNCKENGGTK
jgi:hypothetical protein